MFNKHQCPICGITWDCHNKHCYNGSYDKWTGTEICIDCKDLAEYMELHLGERERGRTWWNELGEALTAYRKKEELIKERIEKGKYKKGSWLSRLVRGKSR